MEPLFKTVMKYTFNEYEKFNKAVISKKIKRVGVCLVLLALCAALLYFLDPDSYISLYLLIFVLIYPVLLHFGIKSKVKKIYESNTLLKGLTETIEFYEEYFFVNTEHSEIRVEYNKLHNILETDTNFYLMIGENQGYLVLKENCDEALIQFISNLKNDMKKKGNK